MRQPESKTAITRDRYDAALFDLDGVITYMAGIHAACWKRMFDEFLQERATQRGEVFRSFDIATDYRLYVDGKPRFDGVRDFLISRGIQLPEGGMDDPPEAETVGGLGNRKNDLVNKIIEEKGVEPYEGSIKLNVHCNALHIQSSTGTDYLSRDIRTHLAGQEKSHIGNFLRASKTS